MTKESKSNSFEIDRKWLSGLLASQLKIASKALLPISKGIQFLIENGTLYITAIGDNAIMTGKVKVDLDWMHSVPLF